MRSLSWQEFEQAVDTMAARYGDRSHTGVYGIPRGGLVLAVTLSHRLELPLLEAAQPGCLLVDDVYETGRTLEAYRHVADCTALVWVSKVMPQWWQAVEVVSSNEWIVFPWESAAQAAADEQAYRASRR
jgi:hypoxanthine phosphoribosyltransferase